MTADLGLLRMQFETLPAVTDDIDVRNARFSGVALRKLMYLLRQDTRTEGQLQLIVDALARDRAPDLEFDVYRCELLADGFLYTLAASAARARPPSPWRGAPPATPPPSGASSRPACGGRSRAPAWRPSSTALLGARASVPLSAAAPEIDEEYVRLIYTAAYGLDGGSPFRFERDAGAPEERLERHGIYGFPRGFLVRRPRRG